jgi:uncharacterized repeat protein (TIGR01451 family)
MKRRFPIVAAIVVALAVPGIAWALFVNGGFEAGDFSSWTKSTFLNSGGLTGTPPFSGASITRAAGGFDQSAVVTAATPETGVDPQLGATATLKFPKFGLYSGRVNYSAINYVSNSIVQQSVVASGDVDPSDSLVHIRFAYAPVLENPGHAANIQPYFYIGVKNVTKGNALLFESLNFSNQSGVPWKTSPINSGVLYTDWQIADIAPGNSQLAVGDTVEIEVIGADCAASGHYGYVYVDAFGSSLPGLSVVKTANRTLVSPGDALTYTFTYRNTGSTAVNSVVVTETIPAQTTFTSVSDAACAFAAGVVTCNFGTMNAGASATFQVIVSINAGATVSIDNGNYTIAGTGVGTTLGPLVSVPLLGAPADISVTKTVSPTSITPPGDLTYTVTVNNAGPNTATGVTVTDTLPAQLSFVSAVASQGVCTGVSTITCSLGSITMGGSATVTIVGHATSAGGAIVNTATATGSFTDPNPGDNTASATASAGQTAETPIPTLSGWGLMLLGVLVAMVGWFALRRGVL